MKKILLVSQKIGTMNPGTRRILVLYFSYNRTIKIVEYFLIIEFYVALNCDEMHSNRRKMSSGKVKDGVPHFTYPDSQLTSDIENEIVSENNFEVQRERILRQEAEAQSVRLAGLLEKAVTQIEQSDTSRHNDTSTPQKTSAEIEQNLQNLKIRKESSNLSSRLVSINQQLSQFDNMPTESTNQIEDRVLDLQQQLERVEKGVHQMVGRNRVAPRRWSSQTNLDSTFRNVDLERHSLTPDTSSDRLAKLEFELDKTRQQKDDLRGRLEQMLRYAKSLECELRTDTTALNRISSDQEKYQLQLSVERQKLAEATLLLSQLKNNAQDINTYSKRLEAKLKRCQNESHKLERDNQLFRRENSDLRAEFGQRMFEKDSEMESIFGEISQENSELKLQLEDERSKLRSIREIQVTMTGKFRNEMTQLSNKKELVNREKAKFEEMTQEMENMREIINKQNSELDQIKTDTRTILRATGTEIDSLMEMFTLKHKIPQFTNEAIQGLESEPWNWVADTLAKLKWLKSELKYYKH